ncbi:MAG: phosphopantetheine-binding protein [Pseudomonadota bacterium]
MDIYTEIKKILMEILDLEGQAVTPESLLVQELGVESIDLLELAAALNVRFKVEVREEDIFTAPAGGPAVRVKDLVSYVAWQQRKAETHVHP